MKKLNKVKNLNFSYYTKRDKKYLPLQYYFFQIKEIREKKTREKNLDGSKNVCFNFFYFFIFIILFNKHYLNLLVRLFFFDYFNNC